MKNIILLIALSLLAAGCQGPGVPETRINLGLSNGTTGNFVFPKNVKIEGFELRRTGEEVSLTFDRYEAKNDPNVIGASAEGTAAIIEATSAGAGAVAAQVLKAQGGK